MNDDAEHQKIWERLARLEATTAERDRRMEDRFRAQQEELSRLAVQYTADKAASNEWRGALDDSRSLLMTRKEWDTAHQNLTDKLSAESRSLNVRLSGVNDRLIPLEARQGYTSMTILLSILSMAVAIGVAVLSWLHMSGMAPAK